MLIEQRNVTNIDLHDGKVRDYVLRRDDRGYKVSAIAKEEVLNLHMSVQDLHRLQQELSRPDVPEAPKELSAVRDVRDTATGAPGTVTYTWGTVRVDQRHVTTVSLHTGKVRDCALTRDARGYKLSSASKDEVVHILMPVQDLQKLREVVRAEPTDIVKRTVVPASAPLAIPVGVGVSVTESEPIPVLSGVSSGPAVSTLPCLPSTPHLSGMSSHPTVPHLSGVTGYQWSTMDWLSFN